MINRKILKRIMETEEGPHQTMLFQEMIDGAGGEEAFVDMMMDALERQGLIIEDVTGSPFGEEVIGIFEGRDYAILPDPELSSE